MATLIFKDPKILLNAVNLSSAFMQATIDYRHETQDETAFGDTSRVRKAGLLDWTATLEANQDYATALLDATVFDLVGASAFIFNLNPTSGATSVTNPHFSGPCLLESYNPVRGVMGELNKASLTLVAAGDLKRSTT